MKHVGGVVLLLALAMPASMLASDKGIDELRGDISQLQRQIDELRQALERDTASLDTLARQSLMGLTALNSKIAALQATLASAIEDSHKDAIAGNESLNTKADQMGSEVRSVSESVSDLADRVGTLEQRIMDLQTDLNALAAKPASAGDSGVSQTVAKTDGLAR